jgi:fatty acid desaturase
VTPREIEEFRALRATIRERGSQRIYLFLWTLVAWAASTIATAALAALPVATLLPLLLLAAGF